MEKVKEEQIGQTQEQQLKQGSTDSTGTGGKRKVSRTWEAAMRMKGSIAVYDTKVLL